MSYENDDNVFKDEDVKNNKFYVGHPSALTRKHYSNKRVRGWGHKTLDKAIEHATKMVEETGNPQFVVQVVRVIRPRKMPVAIKVVR